MDPASIAMVGMGASAAGTGLNFFGALSKGKAESRMYEYQAGVAQFNKQIAEQNRDYALATGEIEAGRYGLKARQEAGAIRVGQGASGVAVNSGTAVDVQTSAHDIAKMDMATIRNNAARTAYGYSVEATKYGAQAGMYSEAASNSKKAGYLNAASALISGVSSVSSKWLQGNQIGLWGTTKNPVDVGYATSYGE